MFPPLIASIDTYLNAATDFKINEVKTEVRAEKKKRRKKKTTVDGSLSTLLTNSMEIVSTTESNGILTVVQRPTSQKMDSYSSPRRIKLVSAESDFRFQNDNILLSPVKTAPLPERTSPSTEFSAAKVSPRSKSVRLKKANDPPPPRTAVEVKWSFKLKSHFYSHLTEPGSNIAKQQCLWRTRSGLRQGSGVHCGS
jgi:hypothetical protein